MSAHVLAEALIAFIAGLAVASAACWVFRDRITVWLRDRG